nr:MAG TPA: hypothetical protein [Caudoviricetes sp.]
MVVPVVEVPELLLIFLGLFEMAELLNALVFRWLKNG